MNNTMNESPIEQIVMGRVRRIAVLRMIISGAVFAITLVLLALYGLGREVWVARIFENGPQDFLGHALYLLYAFEHTRFVVQALALVCIASFLYLAREVAKGISTSFISARA